MNMFANTTRRRSLPVVFFILITTTVAAGSESDSVKGTTESVDSPTVYVEKITNDCTFSLPADQCAVKVEKAASCQKEQDTLSKVFAPSQQCGRPDRTGVRKRLNRKADSDYTKQ